MVELDPDRFLNELGRLFESRKALGPVRVTMKRSELSVVCASSFSVLLNLPYFTSLTQ